MSTDLTPDEQSTLAELDCLALRLYGEPYAALDDDQAADVVWESVREMCQSFDPPADPGPRPTDWRPMK